MIAYVLDASVAAKWFLPPGQEPMAEEALQILRDLGRGKVRLLVPDLFWPEFGNIFWKAARIGRISRKTAEESIEAIGAVELTTAPCRPLLKNAFAIAATFGRSVYDGLYVALAVESGTPLVTADERLAHALAAVFPVRWLGSPYALG